MFLLIGNVKVSRGNRHLLTTLLKWFRGKQNSLHCTSNFCTFEVTSRVKIFFLKKREIRNTEYEQLSQEVKLQSRANK